MVWELDGDPGPRRAVHWTVDRRLVKLEGRAAHVVDRGGEALRLHHLPGIGPAGRERQLNTAAGEATIQMMKLLE